MLSFGKNKLTDSALNEVYNHKRMTNKGDLLQKIRYKEQSISKEKKAFILKLFNE